MNEVQHSIEEINNKHFQRKDPLPFADEMKEPIVFVTSLENALENQLQKTKLPLQRTS
jgi:hypothetical protein